MGNIFDDIGIGDPRDAFGSPEDWLRHNLDPNGHVLGMTDAANERRYGTGKGAKALDARAAAVTRDQWQHFLDFYRPIEEQVLEAAMQTDFTAEGDEAGATAASSVNASRGSLARNLSRSGVALTAEERTGVRRRQQNTLTRAVGRAENTTRRGLKDSRANLLAGIVGAGRGVSTTATGGMQSVADMAAARKSSNDALQAQQQASNTQAGATIASAIIAMY